MAHIQISDQPSKGQRIIINGVDFSLETYRGFELVEVGDDPDFAEVGLQVTFAVGRLDLDADADVVVTDNFLPVAQRVRSMSEVA